MQSTESTAAGRLAGEAFAGAVGAIEDFHKAIAGRSAPTVTRVAHDAIATGVYAAVRGGGSAIALGAGIAGALSVRSGAPLADSPGAGQALGALNGWLGDRLDRDASPLAVEMGFRHRGRPIDPAEIENATGRIVVFAHGLMETEHAWRLGATRAFGDPRAWYGSLLAADAGFTPLELRYNTGRHISENGRDLARLLEETCARWPCGVEEVALVGHSMGGLVARSACHYAVEHDYTWVRRVRHVVSLGSPHLGAPLERVTHRATKLLARAAETAPIARALNSRSVGIKDLRHGSLVDEDWDGRDLDDLADDICAEVPLLEGAKHYFVSASLSRTDDGLLGRALGDLLVMRSSATGQGERRRLEFPIEHGLHLGGLTHFGLLCNAEIYFRLRRWLRFEDSLGGGGMKLTGSR